MSVEVSDQVALPNFCSQCGQKRPEQARFCPGCGFSYGGGPTARGAQSNRRFAPLNAKSFFGLLMLSAVVVGIGWGTQRSLTGVEPQETFEEARARNERASMNPALVQLRESAQSSPEDVVAWKALAQALLAEVQRAERPSSTLVFETIDALRKILDLDPQDPFALVNMADISLNQQVFEKSADYYARYLTVTPNDHVSRARYASALAFLGQTEKAVEQLQLVLKEEPNNFHALAYLAVTYAQSGDKGKAKEIGQKALTFAPSDEARARFGEFLSSLDGATAPDTDASSLNAQGSGVPSSSGAAVKPPLATNERGGGGVGAVERSIRANEIAGQKFVKAEVSGETLKLYFTDFPMDKMPPFIRDKFVQKISDQVKTELPGVKSLTFVDADTSAEIHQSPIRSPNEMAGGG